MKKVTICIVLLVLCLFNGQAQLTYGPMIAVNLSSFTEKLTPLVSDYKFGYQVGVNVQYRLMDLVGVSGEVSYAVLGGNNIEPDLIYGSSFASEISNLDLTLHTIDVTGLANIYLPLEIGSISPKLLIGASAAFNLSAKADIETTESSEANNNVTERFVYNDIAGVAGIGADIEMGDKLIIIAVKYRAGLTDVTNIGLLDSFRNSGFALSLAYNF